MELFWLSGFLQLWKLNSMLIFMKKLQSDLKDGKHCAKSQTVSYLQVSLSS